MVMPETTQPYNLIVGETTEIEDHVAQLVDAAYRNPTGGRWSVAVNPRAGLAESNWLRQHRTELADVSRPWVAIRRQAVIARAATLDEVVDQLKTLRTRDALVACVRPEEERPYRIA